MRPYSLLLMSVLLLVPGLAHASVDNGLLAMAPPETILLTSVDVSRTTASPFGQYMLARINAEDSHFKQMIADTGFDPRRDLQQIVFAGLSKPHVPHGRFAILARGTFDSSRIGAAAKSHGAKSITDPSGNTIYVQEDKDNAFAFAFPDTSLAVMGDLASVQEVLANRAAPVSLDPKLLEYANELGGSNDVWFATLMAGTYFNSLAASPEMNNSNALQSVQQSAGGMQFGDTVSMEFDASTRSAQDASSLADVLRFASNLIQMQAGNDPRAAIGAEALQSLQVQTNGSNVHATAAISEAKLEQIAHASGTRTAH